MMRNWITFFLVMSGWLRLAHAASLVDTTFNPGTGANGIVEHVLQQPDGKILICGNFTAFNGADRGYVARLNSDGSVDTSFTAGAGYWVRHMALQTDGRIVIGGYFKNVEGTSRNLIARLNANGSLDTTFNPGSGCTNAIAPGIDGNGDPFVMWCEVLPSGRILAVGNFREYNGASSVGIVAINPDGSRDTTFNVGGGLDSWGRVIKPLSNGQIMVGGWFQNYNGHTANRIVRLNADGSVDTSFSAFYGDKTAIYSVAEQTNGQLITCGHSLNEQGLFTNEIRRLNANGSVDSTWPGYTNEKTESLLMLANGKVLVGGNFSVVNGQQRRGLARFNADGTLDTTFVANTDNYVWTITPGGAGKVLVSGGFTTIDGIARGGVARLNLPEGAGGGVVTPTSPTIVNAKYDGRFQCMVSSVSGFSYTLQYKTTAASTTWNSFPVVAGTGGPITLNDPRPVSPRFYRVEVR
jgi:uncharacterized delta-60 repeat protein